jgi:transposase-like protein
MARPRQVLDNGSNIGGFRWTEKATTAALALADGKTRVETAQEASIAESTLYRWLQEPEFSAEVDRLSLMTGIASRAERLRLAKRIIRQRVKDGAPIRTDKDVLDWLKFAQSETDGIKLDLAALATAAASVADSGSAGLGEPARADDDPGAGTGL